MKKISSLSILKLNILLFLFFATISSALAQKAGSKNSGRSNKERCCIKLAFIPPSKDISAQKMSQPVLDKITPEKTLFDGKSPAPEVEITVLNARGVVQDPSKWAIENTGEEMTINLSKLPKGKYKVKFKAGKEVQEYIVK